MDDLLKRISSLDSSFDEEDSYYFLLDLNLKLSQFNCYSSKEYSLEDVSNLIQTFQMLHAHINVANMGYPRFWTQTPLFVFRYSMDHDNKWQPVSILNPNNFYLVQGAYWENGHYYLVSHKDFLIEANLFVDDETKTLYNYQHIKPL